MRRSGSTKPAASSPTIGRASLGFACFCLLGLMTLGAGPVSVAIGAECPNEAIRQQQGTTSLSDCRAYERVSPDEKNGLDVAGINVEGANVQVGTGGNSVAYLAPGAFPGAESSGLATSYIARRSADSWLTGPVAPPLGTHIRIFGGGTVTYALAPDLSQAAVVTNAPLTPEVSPAGPERFNLFLRDLNAGPYRLLTTAPDPAPALPFSTWGRFAGASADFSHVLFEDTANLLPGASGAETKLYEWAAGNPPVLRAAGNPPVLRLVSAGLPSAVAGSGGPGDPSFGVKGPVGSVSHVMSEDGRRLILTTPGNSFAPSSGEIYMQQDGSSSVQINASERTNGSGSPEPDPAGPAAATFWTASPGVEEILFSSTEQLTDTDRNSGNDLYVYAVQGQPGEHLTQISHAASDPAGTAEAQVLGVLGASRDMSRVYFAAAGQLIAGKGVEGMPNLYLWSDGELKYIATLDPALDSNVYKAQEYVNNTTRTVGDDGRYLAFESAASLPACGDADSPQLCSTEGRTQVYLYDGVAGQLTCVSCEPGGGPTTGQARLGVFTPGARGVLPFITPISNLTDDGHLFFNSQSALLPEDTNGAVDAYEWDGTGLHLVSPGRSVAGVQFMAASHDGRDVYLETVARLVARDKDDLYDLYDARDGGGFPEPAAAGPPCGEATCRDPSAPAPPPASAGSQSFAGPGNAKKPNPRHRAKRRHAKRHHAKHRRGGRKHRHGKRHVRGKRHVPGSRSHRTRVSPIKSKGGMD